MEKLIFSDESYRIRGAIYEVQRSLGHGFLESVYQECLSREFIRCGIPFIEQPVMEIRYKQERITQTFRPDFICFEKIIIEIKAVACLLNEHRAQLRNYLTASGLCLGMLVNFGHFPGVQIERLIRS